MDPLLFTGIVGVSFVGIGLLDHAGMKVNEGAVHLAMEMVKYGGIVYLLKVLSTLFI